MSVLKRITVTDKCIRCGICENPEYNDIFDIGVDGRVTPKHQGLINEESYFKVFNITSICPTQSILIEDEQISKMDYDTALRKLNDLIYQKLRKRPFSIPNPSDYEYKSGIYEVAKIPANYKSEAKYLTDKSAEKAGLDAFEREVWEQYKNIATQYIVQYRVKKLKPFYCYEKSDNNYYFRSNKEIELLLDEVYQLALVVTDRKISLPNDFCTFEVEPNWGYNDSDRLALSEIEKTPYNLTKSNFFHDASYYDCYIDSGDYGNDFKNYYDFERAEAELREDIDLSVGDVINEIVPKAVETLISNYIEKANRILNEKLDTLQANLSKFISSDKEAEFKDELLRICKKILTATPPHISRPYPEMDYHADFHKEYSSESRCEKEAEDLRDRAYRAGERFLENLSSTLDYSYQESLAKELTKWKILVQQTLDAYGKKKPSDCISVSSGNFRCNIYLNNTEAVRCGGLVSHINRLIEDEILHWSGQKIVGSDVQYMSKYDCKIKVYESDCDYRNALFGDRIIKYNIKYSYDVHVEDFKWSAEKVSSVCTEKLNNSEFLKADFQKIKLSFVDGIYKLFQLNNQHLY